MSLFSHSHWAKLAWKTVTGVSVRSYSATRWWSKWEVFNQLFSCFAHVQPFLEANDNISPVTTRHLLSVLRDEDDCATFKLELAAIVDYGQPLVSATYWLEGDGPLVLDAYETLQAASTSFANHDHPHLPTVARRLAGARRNVTEAIQETKAKVQPAINWFRHKFSVDLHTLLLTFKAARIFRPVTAQAMALTPHKLQCLRAFPFVTEHDIEGLVQELPVYIAAIADVAVTDAKEVVLWWSRQRSLPSWQSVLKKILLVQPSSAAAERVFSLLSSHFSDQQERALEDNVETALMLSYNRNH